MSRFVQRWWWMGAVLLFAACVALKLNGSSIGCWKRVLAEPEPIRGLLLSTPKTIRTDEWLVWTPSILAQARHNPPFPIENANLGAGRAPLLMSVPVAYYTTFFRPQLWGFFLFDFERGFSFYWCAKVFGLLFASVWFLQQVGIRSRAIVVFGALWIFFSSYIQWWFSSPAMLPEMVACWAMCLGCTLAFFRETTRWKIALSLLAFIFFGINFVLCLYLPFQIPLLFLGLVLLASLWLEQRRSARPWRTIRGLLLLGATVAAVLLILIPFGRETGSTIQIVAQTEYPGHRHNTGGRYAVWQMFAGAFGFFESENKMPPDFPNICEASRFYPLWPMAILGLVAARVRARVAISPLFVLLAAYIAALHIYCVVKLPDWLLRATLLSAVHEARVLLGLGLASILLALFFLDRYREPVFGKYWTLGGALGAALGLAALYHAVNARDPEFFANRQMLVVLLSINVVLVAIFLWDRARRWLPAVLAPLLICSNGLINPIMQGLRPLTESAAFWEVERIRTADPDGKWIAFGDAVTGQLIKATGASVFNGTKIVPDLPFLHQLDPARNFESVYNRYAWIVCAVQVFPEEARFSLLQDEFYTAYLPPGLPVLRDAGYRYYTFGDVWRDAVFYDFSLAAWTPTEKLWIYGRNRSANDNTR